LVILNPGFSRVKDLARRVAILPAKREGCIPADPREILHGLKAVQDDAIKRLVAEIRVDDPW
jgi:hypothetical protein